MSLQLEIIRAAIPNATEELAEEILWGRTPFPIGRVSAKDLYKAASRFERAAKNEIALCDFCNNKVTGVYAVCDSCNKALNPEN